MDHATTYGDCAEGLEFLRRYAGPTSQFFEITQGNYTWDSTRETVAAALLGFASYIRTGLHQAITPERQAQLDVVSDLLDQAQRLLEDTKTHPGAAAMLIGATAEEYLRTWIESEDIDIGDQRPSIDTYAKELRRANLITKQDKKDIDSWAGRRNRAAHGEWELVDNREEIRIMLAQVNLFMRQYRTGRQQ